MEQSRALANAAAPADPFNGSMTIFRADSLPTEQAEAEQTPAYNGNVKLPVRPSLSMKKPSIDFNACGPDFINKVSLAAAQANAASVNSEGQNGNSKGGGKRPGKMFWNIASSLRKMVTKRLGGKSSSSTMSDDQNL